MKKIFLIFLVFITIFSIELPIIKYNEVTQFNKDNNKFKVEYTGEETGLLIYVNQENKASEVKVECIGEDGESESTAPFFSPGWGQILEIYERECTLSIESNTEEDPKGTIWINPMNKEIDIDLSKNYGYMYTLLNYDTVYPTLTYNVKNLENDVTVIFEYNSEYNMLDMIKTSGLLNPFQVCNEEDCSDNVETYDFKKGKNYKIYVKQQQNDAKTSEGNVFKYYFMAGYSFYPKGDYNNSKFIFGKYSWIISMLVLFLL